MQKVSKRIARKYFLSGIPVWFCPSKCYPSPSHPFNLAILMDGEAGARWTAENKVTGKFSNGFDMAVTYFKIYNCNSETGTGVTFYVEQPFPLCQIEFCGDHAQYFPGRPSVEGFEGPYIGAGSNEAAAYQDAKEQAYMALDGSEIPPLPKRAGSKKRGMSYYFDRAVAADWRKSEDSELYIYCVLYVPKIAPAK